MNLFRPQVIQHADDFLHRDAASVTTLIATLDEFRIRRIVTCDPHAFNTLKNEYPQFGAQYDVVHHTTFLADLIKDGKLKPKKNQDTGEVTFHDSCYLGRWNDVYSDPRDILAAVPELNVVLPPTAIGKDYPYRGAWYGLTSSRTGVFVSLGGYLGLTIGWVEGIELNLFGGVLGLDIRRPALKFPGVGRLGLPN